MRIIDFLNTNHEALMVIITFVYVVATVAICWANIKSAIATRDQLAESKKQYNETKRLENMPCCYLNAEEKRNGLFESVELTEKITGDIISKGFEFEIENIGKGIAKDTRILISTNLIKLKEIAAFPFVPIQKSAHEERLIPLLFFADKGGFKNGKLFATLIVQYNDLLNNAYKQSVNLVFSIDGKDMILELKSIQAPTLYE